MINEKLKEAAHVAGKIGYSGMKVVRDSLIAVYMLSASLALAHKCGREIPQSSDALVDLIETTADTSYTTQFGEKIYLKDIDKDGHYDFKRFIGNHPGAYSIEISKEYAQKKHVLIIDRADLK